MILADHDSHKGDGSFPGMTTLADESCLKNRQTATDVVKRLVAKGQDLTRDMIEKIRSRDLKRMKLKDKDARVNEQMAFHWQQGGAPAAAFRRRSSRRRACAECDRRLLPLQGCA